ncbi:MAG: phage holin family protein [Chloroflexi bacterium]|nr:MAG: phage holin family protein [Chloroflexota bacterium]
MADNGEATLGEARVRQWAVSENDERTLGELLTDLTTDFSSLMRKEIQLARVETMEKVNQATQSIVWIVAGGMIAYAGFIALVIAGIVGLAAFMPLWLSALILGLVLVIVSAILIQSGRSSLKEMSVVPEKTVESIKEDAEFVKEKVT